MRTGWVAALAAAIGALLPGCADRAATPAIAGATSGLIVASGQMIRFTAGPDAGTPLKVAGIYARIDDIKGTSTNANYKDWIVVTGFTFDPVSGLLTFTSPSDRAEPPIAKLAITATSLARVKLDVIVDLPNDRTGLLTTIETGGTQVSSSRATMTAYDTSYKEESDAEALPQSTSELYSTRYRLCAAARQPGGSLGTTTCEETGPQS